MIDYLKEQIGKMKTDIVCPDCGNYYGGHATCCLDVCDCHMKGDSKPANRPSDERIDSRSGATRNALQFVALELRKYEWLNKGCCPCCSGPISSGHINNCELDFALKLAGKTLNLNTP